MLSLPHDPVCSGRLVRIRLPSLSVRENERSSAQQLLFQRTVTLNLRSEFEVSDITSNYVNLDVLGPGL